jgi:PTH1 family peptidyl-tRNA hydrolase
VKKYGIIGLGNPGSHYTETRHNIGFWILDEFAKQNEVTFSRNEKFGADTCKYLHKSSYQILLIKPFTFMNNSGTLLPSLLKYSGFGDSHITVVHDELNLPLGVLKVSNSKGAGGHNGVKSIMTALNTPFTRVRIGIGGKPKPGQSLSSYVLSSFNQVESEILSKRLPHFLDALHSIIESGVEKTMNIFNQEKQIETTS